MNKCCFCGLKVKGKIHAGCALYQLGECTEEERIKMVKTEIEGKVWSLDFTHPSKGGKS